MSRSIPSLKYAALGAAIAGSLALAGCGAGQVTQTSSQVASVDGGSGTIGQIAVRDATIAFGSATGAAVYPQGGSAPLQATIVNSGASDDRLVSASSPAASSVDITGNPTVAAGRALLISGGAATSGSGSQASGSASAAPTTGGAAPSTSASPTSSAAAGATTPARPTSRPASATPTSGGAATAVIPTPNEQGQTTASIVLTGLTKDVQAGLTYPVQLTFAKAGTVTVEVPVANPSSPRPSTAG